MRAITAVLGLLFNIAVLLLVLAVGVGLVISGGALLLMIGMGELHESVSSTVPVIGFGSAWVLTAAAMGLVLTVQLPGLSVQRQQKREAALLSGFLAGRRR